MAKDDEWFLKMGKKFKELRKQEGYSSYASFAWEHDLSRKYYWQVEKGQSVGLIYLFRLLDIHNLT
jgi:hypothetical protein